MLCISSSYYYYYYYYFICVSDQPCVPAATQTWGSPWMYAFIHRNTMFVKCWLNAQFSQFCPGFFFLLKLHITIQKGGSFPELKRCSTCCSAYHCPFCRPSLFRPTKLSKVRAHLDSHFNRAVFHAGKVCKHCLLEWIFILPVNWQCNNHLC